MTSADPRGMRPPLPVPLRHRWGGGRRAQPSPVPAAAEPPAGQALASRRHPPAPARRPAPPPRSPLTSAGGRGDPPPRHLPGVPGAGRTPARRRSLAACPCCSPAPARPDPARGAERRGRPRRGGRRGDPGRGGPDGAGGAEALGGAVLGRGSPPSPGPSPAPTGRRRQRPVSAREAAEAVGGGVSVTVLLGGEGWRGWAAGAPRVARNLRPPSSRRCSVQVFNIFGHVGIFLSPLNVSLVSLLSPVLAQQAVLVPTGI